MKGSERVSEREGRKGSKRKSVMKACTRYLCSNLFENLTRKEREGVIKQRQKDKVRRKRLQRAKR